MGPGLEKRGGTKGFGGLTALAHVRVAIEPGAIAALIGPNGAGKTTLFNCLTGLAAPDAGSILFEGRSIAGLAPHAVVERGIARTFQNVRLFAALSARDNVMVGLHCPPRRGLWAAICRTRRAVAEEADAAERADALLDLLEIGAMADVPAAHLAYGVQRRVEGGRGRASGARPVV